MWVPQHSNVAAVVHAVALEFQLAPGSFYLKIGLKGMHDWSSTAVLSLSEGAELTICLRMR
eukprot:9751050-Prorocentrum_lima.AAC.1